MDVKQAIASILKIAINDQWDIFDSHVDDGLYLVHHTPTANIEKYGWLKGVIVDVPREEVVCQTYGASVTVSLSMFRDIAPTNNVFMFTSLDGQNLVVPEENATWVKGHDGTLVRVWKHPITCKIYISSHKRIDTSNANWGGSETFTELYKSLNGPLDTLFPDNSPSCYNHVYSFMIIHPALQIGSRIPLEKPKLMYLGEHLMKPSAMQTPSVLEKFERPEEYSLKQVNCFLRDGYYPMPENYVMSDPRMTNGEFCMLFEFTDANKTAIKRCIKVTSDAYDWRVRMRNNEPDLRKLVFSVAAIKTRDMSTRNGYRIFTNRYLNIGLPMYDQLPYLNPNVIPDQDVINHQRETAIASLVYATHPIYQTAVLNYFGQYMSFLRMCVDWIMWLHNNVNPTYEMDLIEKCGDDNALYVVKRIRNIMEVSSKRATDMNGNKELNFYNSVRYLVENEYGESLYRMFRVYNRMCNIVV